MPDTIVNNWCAFQRASITPLPPPPPPCRIFTRQFCAYGNSLQLSSTQRSIFKIPRSFWEIRKPTWRDYAETWFLCSWRLFGKNRSTDSTVPSIGYQLHCHLKRKLFTLNFSLLQTLQPSKIRMLFAVYIFESTNLKMTTFARPVALPKKYAPCI